MPNTDVIINSFDQHIKLSDRLGKAVDENTRMADVYRTNPTEENLQAYLLQYGNMLRLSTAIRQYLDR